jgi:hypothetical protein
VNSRPGWADEHDDGGLRDTSSQAHKPGTRHQGQ